jgi:predicted DNA-binding transcriptional regulator YafY
MKENKRVYYQYADTSFSINNMPLNETDINRLQTTLQTISQFKGMPQFEWMHELLPRLKQGSSSDSPDTIVEFDNNQYLDGIGYIGPIYNAILYKKALKIDYLPYLYDNQFQIIIHPYYLKQYNNRWFLFGYNPEKDKYDWNIALDRIKNITEIPDKYIPNTNFDWNEYFEDMIGVTKPYHTEPEKIMLRFYGKTGHYIESKPIHGSQKSQWIDKDILEVQLELIVNYELERFILSYADSVKVIQPQSLIDKIKNRLQDGYQQYAML